MRVLIFLVLLILLPGAANALLAEIPILVHSPTAPMLLAGALLGTLLYVAALRRADRLTVFEHELTHALVALLFFRRITQFVVRRSGGSVQHSGGFGGDIGNEFIGMAPYVLPTFTFFSVVFRPLLSVSWLPWFDGWIGFSFGFHVWSTLAETREAWTRRHFRSAGSGEWVRSDLGRRGLLYSLVFILSVSLAIHGLMLTVFLRGYGGMAIWGGRIWHGAADTLGFITGRLIDLIERIL